MRASCDRLPCSSTAGTPAAVSLRASNLGAVLGAGEDQRAAGRRGQVDEHRQPRVVVDVQHVVGHRRHGRLRGVDAVGHRVAQEPLDQHVDAAVQRGREEHPLAVAGSRVEQPAYDRQEAEVGHVVGLVEHGDLDAVERDVPALQVVREPAGAGDDDVDAAAQRGDLRVGAPRRRRPSGCAGRALVASGAIAASIWRGELAGRRQDQRARAAGPARLLPLAASRARTGRTNAYVLPEPVRPRPSTSRPASESGRVAAWIGNGWVMPALASASTRRGETPSSAKRRLGVGGARGGALDRR